MADEVKITYLPPGEALGARDLQRWAHRRALGKAGGPPTRKEEKQIKQRQRAAKRAGVRYRHDAASLWLRRQRRRAALIAADAERNRLKEIAWEARRRNQG
jgi:hypothetical protein